MNGCRRVRAEEGVSLVEVLVALAILGVAVTSIVAGLTTASIASDVHRSQVNGDAVVRSYAEAIKEQVHLSGYVSCATTASYPIPIATWKPPPGYAVSIGQIKIWHAGSWNASCPPTDDGAQMLSLVAKSDDGRDTESLDVLVRTP